MKKLFVWDFHGVLEKGNENSVRDYINAVLEEQGYPQRISSELCNELYGIKVHEYFAHVCPGLTPERYMELQGHFLMQERKRPEILLGNIKPTDGAFEVLRAIDKSEHDQIILSGVEAHMMPVFIDSVGIGSFFPEHKRLSTNHHDGAQYSKREMVEAYLAAHPFDHIVAIDDFPPGLNAVQSFSNTTYLYAHPGREFRDYPATHRIRDLRDILKEI